MRCKCGRSMRENYLIKNMSGVENFVQTKIDGPCQNITRNDVVEVPCGMKAGKAGGHSKVTSDLLKLCGEV